MKNLNLKIDDIIINALKEDMPFGDISTDALFTGSEISKGNFTAKEEGVIAGLFVVKRVFEILDSNIKFTPFVEDGQKVEKGKVIAKIEGAAANVLKGERIALNLLQRMSGIATQTYQMASLIADLDVRVVDTRKTTPGLRILEKYAVKMGGGHNHRFSLSDAVMLKDNHIKAAGGIKQAVKKAREAVSHTTTIEVETETLDQVKEALETGADIIMLDNMCAEQIKEAVNLINKQAVVEISGNITVDNIREKAVTGVDVISSGSLTHSVKAMDISLKFI